MQPIAPTHFPRRVKRYQSYSMTPLDFQMESQNQLQQLTLTSSNKINFAVPTRKPGHHTLTVNLNSVTNSFCSNHQQKHFETESLNLNNCQKAQLGSEIKEQNSTQKTPNAPDYKKHRKMFTSEIFEFSSMNDKNSLSDQKSSQNSASRFKNGERKSFQNGSFKSIVIKTDKKDRQIHIPSFLLNKKKQFHNSDLSSSTFTTTRQLPDESCSYLNDRSTTDKRSSFKKQRAQILSRNIENECSQSVFLPPTNEKIAFSKATASTLCTSLPRQQSRRTFKDFEEMEELKQIQNSIEESDHLSVLQNQFDNLFIKETPIFNHAPNLQNQIAQLFSDEDIESEEYNEELQHELEDLF